MSPASDTNSISSLSILTLNCGAGGLRARLFELSHDASRFLSSAAIVCLQECHLPAPVAWDDTKALQDALRVSVAPPFRAALGRDTGIIVRDPAIHIDSAAHGARWTHVSLSSSSPICGSAHSVSVWSIHGPFHSQEWTVIAEAIESHSPPPGTPIIIGADWNSIPDPILDSLHGDPTGVPWHAPAAAIAPTNAVDIFRVLRPDTFSWTFASPTSARRLDSVWASPELLSHVSSTDVASCRSDHRAVRVTFLQTSTAPSGEAAQAIAQLPPHRPWSLHPGLWNDPVFSHELQAFAASYNPPPRSSRSAIDDWALYHGKLFTFLQPLARTVSSTQQWARADLDLAKRELDALDLRDPHDADLLPVLLRRWRAACSSAASSASLRPGGHSSASALREGSWLFSSFASAASRTIPPLITQVGLAVSPAAKLQALTAFYADLFSLRPVLVPTPSSALLDAIQLRLDPSAGSTANTPFTLKEVYRALRTANRHSSSGPDGIPYRVYLATFESSGPLLQALANALGEGPHWPVTARTIILPKSGDAANMSNYRPITITNAYVRIVSRLLSGRFLSLGERLLPWTQSAFLPGRRSSLIAGALHAIHDLQQLPRTSLTPPPMFVISIDQKKAYDRVHRSWLFAVLAAVRLPPLLQGVLRALYSSPSTRISALGALGPLISLLSGVLQGDPASCFLYNLTLQPLFDLLARLNIGVPIPILGTLSGLAFADDSLFFLEASPLGLSQLPLFLACLDSYANESGAAINTHKSSFWLLGTPSLTDAAAAQQLADGLLAYGLTSSTPSGPLSHLGYPLPSEASDPHPKPLLARLSAIARRAACFRTHGVDLYTRVLTANRLLGSRLWHSIAVGPLPADLSRKYFDSVLPYLRGSRASISPTTLTRPLHHGGFGLIDPDAMATGLSISFLKRYLCSADRLGLWLRTGLTTYLAQRHGIPPAVLLIRSGSAFGRLRQASTRADGFFGRLAHALATVELGISPTWISLPAPALLTLPWLWPWTARSDPHPLHKTKLQSLIRDNWLTWGDVLWHAKVPMGGRSAVISLPLGPPAGRSVSLNGIVHPFSSQRPTNGPALHACWNDLWRTIPSQVRATLTTWGSSTTASAPLLERSAPSSQGWTPTIQDPLAEAFPWAYLTVFGTPLATVSTSLVRKKLQARRGPRRPKWPQLPGAPLDPSAWTAIWSLLRRLPLSPVVRTTSVLILNKNVWTHYDKTSETRSCPAACGSEDGVHHGYFACPSALAVWTACLPLLIALGCPAPPDFSAATLLRCDGIPRPLRSRFALWRSTVLHMLYVCRHQSATHSTSNTIPIAFDHVGKFDVLSNSAALLADLLSSAWDRVLLASTSQRPDAVSNFQETWARGGSFLQFDGDLLAFSALSNPS
ncbi:hypothetical protein CF326_g5806 [Tilletia indica]|nr:hypothetical protein CF326_g5806 [Tilletia indica]